MTEERRREVELCQAKDAAVCLTRAQRRPPDHRPERHLLGHSGWDSIGTWLLSTSVIVAPMRLETRRSSLKELTVADNRVTKGERDPRETVFLVYTIYC